jgi:hypothetical protein
MTLKYTTTTQLAEILGIVKKVPSWTVGATPSNEEVGTGDNSKTIFYLDQLNILADSYTLYYGADATATDPLIETTDYTLDKDSGKITLTTAGVTKLGTNKIFAEYKYVSNGMTEDFLTTTLERAEKEVDDTCNTTFNDGTVTNPTYPFILREKHPSQYIYNPMYFSDERPLIDVASTLAADIDDVVTSIVLATGTGTNYPSTGYIIIDKEVISYTGITTDTLTGCTRGQLGSTATSHLENAEVHTTIVEISDTYPTGTPIWQFLAWNTGVTVNNLGKFYIYEDCRIDNIYQDVADRVRISYYNGFDTIPKDITRLALLFAKRQLIQDNIGKSMIAGRDEFNPEMFNADMNEIKMIVDSYRQNGMGNT